MSTLYSAVSAHAPLAYDFALRCDRPPPASAQDMRSRSQFRMLGDSAPGATPACRPPPLPGRPTSAWQGPIGGPWNRRAREGRCHPQSASRKRADRRRQELANVGPARRKCSRNLPGMSGSSARQGRRLPPWGCVIGARFEFLGAARAHGGASFPATPCANKSRQEFWELHGCSARKKASPA